MRRVLCLVTLSGAALLGGCAPVKSMAPLVDGKHAVSDPKLIGKWLAYSAESELYEVKVEAAEWDAKEPQTYKVTFSGLGGKSEYHARVGRWDNDEFADVQSISGPQALEAEAIPNIMWPAYSFCRIRHDGDLLWLAFMEDDWLRKNLPACKWLEGFSGKGKYTIFTGSTEQLQALVRAHAHDDKAFFEFAFAREGTLASYAQSLEVGYQGSGKAYAKEGRYEQAVIAWQRYLELVPQDPEAHLALALTLLGSNKPGQAREEFVERTRLCKDVPAPGHGRGIDPDEWCQDESPALESFRLGLAYFAVNEYDPANREFEKSVAGGTTGLDYPPLWEFLALRAAGKEIEAQQLLDDGKSLQYAPSFPLDQYLRGQITEAALLNSAKESWQACQAYFVIGSQAMIAGDKAKAREWFDKKLRPTDFCPDYMAVTMSARLKQLDAGIPGKEGRNQ